MNLRKLIREEIGKILNKQDNNFIQDINYLKNFSLNKKTDKSNNSIWVFQKKQHDYVIRFYIKNDHILSSWEAKLFIYWKEPTKEFTNAKGKDFEHSFGPFTSYEDMVKELNRKLNNHPLISSENYMDDNNKQFDNDVVEMVKHMLKCGEKIEKVKDKHFDKLKKIYQQIKNIKTIEELEKYINDKFPGEEEKQTLLLIIQKIYQLDFYLAKEQIESLF